MQIEKLLGIIKRYTLGKASAREKKAVDDWYDSVEGQHTFKPIPEKDLADAREQSYNNIIKEIGFDQPVIPFYKRKSWRIAATILILLGAGVFVFYLNGKNNTGSTAQYTAPASHDVAPPKTNKAILILANGKKIILDSTGNGQLAMQGDVSVVKKESGLIVYDGASDETVYNTLSVPKGSRPQKLALADGSQVWLNVASSITYPVSFTGKERMVEVSGEAYFEVAKNARMPFVVKKKNSDAEIRVLGTHFNVNAYEDEHDIRVSLLEGSVQTLTGNGQSLILKPGEQASISHASDISHNVSVDMEEVMAWKDGRFYFEGVDMKTIMRQVEKWYDVDIQFNTNIDYSFVAKISRDVNVSELLKIFELTDLVHFKIEGKKITIMK